MMQWVLLAVGFVLWLVSVCVLFAPLLGWKFEYTASSPRISINLKGGRYCVSIRRYLLLMA